MLALGTHPRLAALLLASTDAREQALACDLAALLEARDPLTGRQGDRFADRWQALAAFRGGGGTADASRGALAAIDRASAQWRQRLRVDAKPPTDAPPHLHGDLLRHAFPDRIGHQHPTDPRRYQLANGRSVRLFDDSALFGEPWIVASELRDANGEAQVMRGAALDESRLRRECPERFVETDIVRWDDARRALVSQREQRFDAIVLDSRPAGRVDPTQAARALTDAVRTLGLDVLPWTPALRQWQARVVALRQWLALDSVDVGALPDVADTALLATLDDWLLPAFAGKTRLDALDAATFAGALHARMDFVAQRQLDALAPVRIQVPSGQARSIEYAIDADGRALPPVLAVKVQELFGLAETPRIAGGRIALTLHLLSPAGRPLQVTQDLRSFWARTWPEVRREMKGRYPRHPWPEDPWNAPATHRAKPRGT